MTSCITNPFSSIILFSFSNENVLQQIIITWPDNDEYADEMVQRIIDSIELKPDEPEEEDN